MSETTEGVYVPNWSMMDVLRFKSRRAEQARRVQTEQALLRNIDREARDAGLPVDVIKAVDKPAKRDRSEAIIYVRQFVRIAAACGIYPGPQTNIFDQETYEPTSEEQHWVNVARAEQEGFDAGRGGLDKDSNPYPVGSEESQAWAKWHSRGVDAAKYANGGTPTAMATKAQPKARQRTQPEPQQIEAPVIEAQPEVIEEPAQEAPRKRRGRPPKSNGSNGANVVAMPKRKAGRPKGAKDKKPRVQRMEA